MTSRRLEYHYLKLHRRYAGDGVETSLQELADLLSCTRRHVRSLLGQMETQGWIQWQSRAGRGYRSTLRCLYAPDLLLHQRVEQLLAQGHVEQA
ncbi:MAG: SgrR family transcriptional regulator, partial [Aeromonadaceae bacterium]|nr:SgrR family transcriptional regulator [Aeromonadaceae bacterium]